MKFDQKLSTAYHHGSVGSIERSLREFNKYFRIYLDENNENWDTFCYYLIFCYNITQHESNGNMYSPYKLIFSKNSSMPHEIFSGGVDPLYNVDNFALESKFRLQKAHEFSKKIIDKLKIRNKHYYEKNSTPIKIEIGEMVFLNKEPYNKLSEIKSGPFKIIEIDYPNVILDMNNKNYKVHMNRISKII